MSDNKLNDLVLDEVNKAIEAIKGDITDPSVKLAIAQMATDFAMLPIRIARGEDVTHLAASLKAEAALRGVSTTLKAQKAMQDAWINIVLRIITTALTV